LAKFEYRNKIVDGKQQYNGMYVPDTNTIQIDTRINVFLKILTIFHEMIHWTLDKLIDSPEIYDKFSDLFDRFQDNILPW